jgi:phytoene dehydrogenase-like protein
MTRPDAIVVGSGPNGLVAANLLADRGWDVLVLEARDSPGGAVRTEELTLPGFHHDVFSSFYPFAGASPIMRGLRLEDHGLRWIAADAVVGHPLSGGRSVVLHRDVDTTAASVARFAPGDDERWRAMVQRFVRDERAGVISAFYGTFPPVNGGLRLLRDLGPSGVLRLARFGLKPAREICREEFEGEGAGLLIAGNALHASLTPEQVPSGAFGWLMCMLAQTVGFPVPEGGAGRLIDALVARLRARGGTLRCDAPVEGFEVRAGRVTGARLVGGEVLGVRRAVLADVFAPTLYRDMLPPEEVPATVLEDLERFHLDDATFKVDWALDGPIPWEAEDVRAAGTLHVAEGIDALTRHGAQVAMGRLPEQPALVMGQYAPVDPTRMPPGKEVAWAYTHLPRDVKGDAAPEGLRGDWADPAEVSAFADRIEAQVEAYAPGFRSRILARNTLSPRDLERRNPNLVEGAINSGSATLDQMLVFRPTPRQLGRPETPVRGLFLASASAHPGGGVHGVCGANAARAALLHARVGRLRPRT